MKQYSRKIFVLALTLVFVLGVVNLAYGATVRGTVFTDISGHAYEEALKFLGAFGIFTGPEGIGGPVYPNDTLTRAEFCKVVVHMLDKQRVAQALSTYPPRFTDAVQIPIWAWGYVNTASNMGIIKGFEDGTFRANEPVTWAQALAMVIRALKLEAGVTGVWPLNYVVFAYDAELVDDLDVYANLPITRGEMAQLAYNAMHCDKKWDADANDFADEPRTPIVEDAKFGFQLVHGLVEAVDPAEDEITVDGEEYALADHVVLSGAASFDALLNVVVDLYIYDDEVRYIKAAEADVIVGLYDEIKEEDGEWFIVLTDGTEVGFDPENLPVVTVNETERDVTVAAYMYKEFEADDELTITVSEDLATYVRALRWNIAAGFLTADPEEGTEEDTWVLNVTTPGGTSYEVTVDADTTVVLNGEPAVVTDLAENDVLYIATENADPDNVALRVDAYRNVVSGAVTKIVKYDDYWDVTVEKADGTEVQLRADVGDYHGEAFTVGDEADFFLNKLGRISYVDVVGVVTEEDIVKILSTYTVETEDETEYFVTVDQYGVTVDEEVYNVALHNYLDGQVGVIGELVVTDDAVKDFVPYIGPAVPADAPLEGTVYSVDVAAGKVVVEYVDDAGTTRYAVSSDALAVYAEDDGEIGEYIGVEGLEADDEIYFALDAEGKVIAIVKKTE